MTAFDYSRPQTTANRLLGRFGQSGYIRRPGAKTGPAHNPTVGSVTNDACTFVITDYRSREIDGTRVLATDKKAMIAPGTLPSAPKTVDLLVEADGSVYKIIDVKTVKPASTVILYEAQVRR